MPDKPSTRSLTREERKAANDANDAFFSNYCAIHLRFEDGSRPGPDDGGPVAGEHDPIDLSDEDIPY